MASDSLLYRCYYCHFESTNNSFKYFDNKKVDQPRHQCHQCHKLFTLGSHGRPQGRTYAKKRNEDPAELKSLSRQCRHCGVADNAPFKYYNNNNRLQPRFKCLSCGKQFQMRLMGSGDEMRLVHTSCNQRHVNIGLCKKPREPEAFTNASNFGEESYQPSDGSFMPVPFDLVMPLEPSVTLLSESSEEDVEDVSSLEAKLTDENESVNVDPISCDYANVDNYGLLPELSAEETELLALLEFESLTDENERAPTVDPINEDDGLPPALSAAENAEFLAFYEAGFLTDANQAPNVDDGLLLRSDNDADFKKDFEVIETGVRTDESDESEMVSENMTSMDSDCTSNPEVVSDTMLMKTHAPTEPDSWSNDTMHDSSSPNYLEAALACCKFMDMAHSKPVAPVQLSDSSSPNAGSTISFGDSSCVTSERYSFQQDLMEEDQRSVNDWNEWQEEEDDMEMAPWS